MKVSDGGIFDVWIWTQTATNENQTYSLYMLNDVSIQKMIGDQQGDRGRKLHRASNL
jgi:hypothetical protein|tara:strand:- start:679 stop:849 length:171 start_codon:yes stop_codon:yes gene_type:complete